MTALNTSFDRVGNRTITFVSLLVFAALSTRQIHSKLETETLLERDECTHFGLWQQAKDYDSIATFEIALFANPFEMKVAKYRSLVQTLNLNARFQLQTESESYECICVRKIPRFTSITSSNKCKIL